jgi:hypothetical protein
MENRGAAKITLPLSNRPAAMMKRKRKVSLGIKHAAWLHSGAPCEMNPKNPEDWELRQDAIHRAANGKQFEVSKGMFLDGKWTWPGNEPGCRCMSKPVVPGFS